MHRVKTHIDEAIKPSLYPQFPPIELAEEAEKLEEKKSSVISFVEKINCCPGNEDTN